MVLNNEFGSQLPLIGSHEPAGTIVELGSEVTGWKKGERVGALNFDQCCGP
jgi:propanol-preferring alcohol dehydrogenase